MRNNETHIQYPVFLFRVLHHPLTIQDMAMAANLWDQYRRILILSNLALTLSNLALPCPLRCPCPCLLLNRTSRTQQPWSSTNSRQDWDSFPGTINSATVAVLLDSVFVSKMLCECYLLKLKSGPLLIFLVMLYWNSWRVGARLPLLQSGKTEFQGKSNVF